MKNEARDAGEIEFDTHTHECRGCGDSVRCGNDDECDGGDFGGYCRACLDELDGEPSSERPCNCPACLIGDGH